MLRICLILLILAFNTAHTQTWKELMDSSMHYNQKNDLTNAISFGKKALEKAQSELGTIDTNICNIASYLTFINWSAQLYNEGLKYARLDSSVRVQTYGKGNKEYFIALMNIGSNLAGLNDLKNAEAYFLESINEAKNLYKGDHSDIADLMHNLSQFYGSIGETAKADSVYKEGEAMFLRTQSYLNYVDTSNFYQQNNDFYKAIEYAEIALDTAKKQVGLIDTNIANIASNLTFMYWRLQKFEKALEYARLDSSIKVQTTGKETTGYIYTLLNIGAQYMGLGNMDLAIVYNRECVETAKKVFKGDHPTTVMVLNNLGHVYKINGEYGKADPIITESIEMSRRLFQGDDFNMVQSLTSAGIFYQGKGDFSKAEGYFIESIEMVKRLLGGQDHANLSELLGEIATFYEIKGDMVKAENFYIEALEMNRRLYSTDNFVILKSLNQLGSYYLKRGDFRQAESIYKEVQEINNKIFSGDDANLALSIGNLAYFYMTKGDNKKAEEYFLESLEMHRRLFKVDNFGLGNSMNNIAAFYESRKEYDKAEPYFVEGLEMSRRLFKGDNQSLATSIHNMAYFYAGRGKYDLAEPLYIESLEMTRRLYPQGHPDLVNAVTNFGLLYYRMGQFEKSEALIKESVEMSERLFEKNNMKLAVSYQTMATFYRNTGNPKSAEIYYKKSQENFTNVINNYFPALSDDEKRKFWETISEVFESYYSFAAFRAEENPQIIGRMFDLQLYSKALLFNSYGKIKNRIVNSNDSALISKYNQLTEMKELIARVYSMTDETRKRNGFDINALENEATNLEKSISLKSEYFKQSYEMKKVTWRTIQAVLKPDEAAVEVVRFRHFEGLDFKDTIYYAFLIITDSMDEHPEMVILDNGYDMENNFYNEYRNNINLKEKDTISYSRYWSKLSDKLKKYKKVYFSADGIYHKLNPATLLNPDGDYLLDKIDIQQINSTRDILMGFYQMKEESNVFNSAVLVGNPNFSLEVESVREISKTIRNQNENSMHEVVAATRGITLTKLPGTEKEIINIESFLKSRSWEVNTYLEDKAVKASVKAVKNPRILHIATHGLFLEDVNKGGKEVFGFEKDKLIENPLLRSGLFFTGAENYNKSDFADDDNGILTAYEAMNLSLDKTELVVLSACETGLGEIQNGEGVFGLRRAFQQAGARTVLMSLWKVNDEATQEIMTNFYSNWVSGMSKREAFAAAQRNVRKKFPNPYYWGAFVMVGE